jgi:hypothetical protein
VVVVVVIKRSSIGVEFVCCRVRSWVCWWDVIKAIDLQFGLHHLRFGFDFNDQSINQIPAEFEAGYAGGM